VTGNEEKEGKRRKGEKGTGKMKERNEHLFADLNLQNT